MNKGFSLVELIVVIAIMAILVGVAVPTYTAYITKAEKSVELQTVGDMVYAAKLANVEYDTTAELTCDGDKVYLVFDGDNADKAAEQVASIVASAGASAADDTVTYDVEHLVSADITDYAAELN